MSEENKLNQQLEKLNKNLEDLKSSGRHMIYSASPLKFAIFNFLAGVFHVLGSLFGYIVIFGLIIYLVSQINLNKLMADWMEKTLGQIRWEKIMPLAPGMQDNSTIPSLEDFEDQLEEVIEPIFELETSMKIKV